MKIQLRDYQKKAELIVKKCFSQGKRRIILALPTGSGKTYTATSIVKRTIEKISLTVTSNGNSVLFITDRKELHGQTNNAFSDFNLKPTELTAKVKTIPSGKLVVAMLETIKRRSSKPGYLSFIQSFKLIIFDEAHKNSHNKVFDLLDENQFLL